ncbi:MAG: hypothetical protein IJM17_04565 [Firmicutes bacterium]|nr:hypothetical protein [Bacillota bacterium]
METGGKRLDSVKEFYERTRPENIDALCSELSELIRPNARSAKSGETESWRNSLPEIAELLYDLPSYLKKTANESGELAAAIDKEILALGALKEDPALSAFTASCGFKTFSGAPGRADIKRGLDHELSKSLGALEESFAALREDRISSAVESLKKQKEALLSWKKKLSAPASPLALDGVAVELEYKLPKPEAAEGSPKKNGPAPRIDVLLRDDERKRFAIIELKQWTEDSMEVFVTEEDGEKQCAVRVTPYEKDTEHPALKVRDEYKALLASLAGEGARIRCFVFLHNQFYDGGSLFKAASEGIDIYDGKGFKNNILFTRMRCRSLAESIAELFR